MINRKKPVAAIIGLVAMLLASCTNNAATFPVKGPYMTDKTAKSVYNAYLGQAPGTLNPTKSQGAENVSHLANFIDTLVMNDNYGILRRALASKATKSSDGKVFTFEVRDDAKWVRSNGQDYVFKGQTQYVTAQDFVTTAKTILDYKNKSEIYYMYTLFVNNAWEYYCYTMMNQFMAENKPGYGDLKGNNQKQAEKVTELVREYAGRDPETPITASDIPAIKSFSRVGVKAEGNKIIYSLRTKADFFPTMLTYSPFMPTNENFLKSINGAENYGTSVDTLLYCGAFRLTTYGSTEVKYEKNESYYDKDSVHLSHVNYTVVSSNITPDQMREAYDRGEVDGFSLSKEDSAGWSQYIAGPDGTGTIQDPYSDDVNNRELDSIDYTYHFVLNPNRTTDISSQQSTVWESKNLSKDQIIAEIENTNKALKINEIRRLILDGVELNDYNKKFNAPVDDHQYQMNTFTPRGYVFDESGKDYVDYYYEVYGEEMGISTAEAKELLKPQQISGVQYVEDTAGEEAVKPWLTMSSLRDNAKLAIEKYNVMNASDPIDLPVVIELNGAGGINATEHATEVKMVTLWNERANGCTLKDLSNIENYPYPNCEGGKYPYFEMTLNEVTNSTKWTQITNNGYYTMYTGWGWIGDYADPLTYVHCYVTNGEMSKMSGNNTVELDNYHLEGGELVKDEEYMFEEYNKMVEDASLIDSSLAARYLAFAKCEYKLLNDLKIIKPSYMSSQGWSASVSRACGYENPTAHYGLADHMLKGIWVLVEAPTGKERQDCRDLQAEFKAEALAAVGNDTTNSIFL